MRQNGPLYQLEGRLGEQRQPGGPKKLRKAPMEQYDSKYVPICNPRQVICKQKTTLYMCISIYDANRITAYQLWLNLIKLNPHFF